MFVIKEIPINANEGNQEFEIVLNGTTFRLALGYNSRLDRWSLDVKDPDGSEIITGILLVAGIDLLAQYSMNTKPQGNLFCYDFSAPNNDPTEETLGKTALLLFRHEE